MCVRVCLFQVWLEQSRSQQRRTPTRWWRCGTDHLTSCWAAPTTPLTSTCGQWCSTLYYSIVVLLLENLINYILKKSILLWWNDHLWLNHLMRQTSCRVCACLCACLSVFRGVGCIFYEMATGRPLFPGSTVEEELHFIFKLLGENHLLLRNLLRTPSTCVD